MNGLAIIEKTDTETKGFFIDQDTIEFARQNAKVSKRLDEAAKAKKEADRKADRTRRKAEKVAAQRKAYTLHTAGFVLSRLAICAAVVWIGTVEMIHPAVCIPVALFNLCAACLRLGALFGRAAKK